MKVFISFKVSEIFNEGFHLCVHQANERSWVERQEHLKIVTDDFDIDLASHNEWIAAQAQELAAKLAKEAHLKYAVTLDHIKEFESKFSLLTAQVDSEV